MFIQFENELLEELRAYFLKISGRIVNQKLSSSRKLDSSVVTEVDFFVSQLVNEKIKKYFNEINIIDEEVSEKKLQYPCFIIDPVDGTRELASGSSEFAVSIAFLNSPKLNDEKNYALIFNPLLNLKNSTLDSQRFINLNPLKKRVLVSRTEYKKGLFCDDGDGIYIPVGSIANKLMLLSFGLADSVITKKPKSIWDIAAGCVLINKAGGFCKKDGVRVEELELELELSFAQMEWSF